MDPCQARCCPLGCAVPGRSWESSLCLLGAKPRWLLSVASPQGLSLWGLTACPASPHLQERAGRWLGGSQGICKGLPLAEVGLGSRGAGRWLWGWDMVSRAAVGQGFVISRLVLMLQPSPQR